MKILTGIDLPYAPSCGSLILCEDMYSHLAQRHDVTFVALQSNEQYAGSRLRDVRQVAVTKVTRTQAYGAYVQALLAKLRPIAREVRPDIVHIQHLSYGMALAFAQLVDVPVLALCHGTDILSGLDDEFHCASAQHIVSRADRVVFPTRGMLTDAQRCIHIDEGKVALVPWGVGDAYFSATTRSSYSGGPKRLLFAGRLIRGKGVELALQALRRLSDDYTLTIAGDGPLREEVVWLANALGVQERVVFRGWLSREDLRAEFHRHHLLIAPSQVIEAFCLVAVEAQAAGLPVVHSRVGGLVESCANEELSFEPDDVSELAAAVRRAFADVNAWAAFAGRSASHARRYALTATAGAIERISLALVRAPQSATASGLRSW